MINKIKDILKNRVYVTGIIAVVLLVIFISLSSHNTGTKKEQINTVAGSISSSTEANLSVKPLTTDLKLLDVVKVVDGDTIDVSLDGKIERIRLIGINTPETVDPRKPVECFGKEASDKAKALLSGKKVYLEADPISGERDKYDRLLRFVFLEDGTSFNLLMIKMGYAYEYTYDVPYKYQAEFKQAQKEAEANKAGLWGDSVCPNTTTAAGVTTTGAATQTNGTSTCNIKGNIGSTKEKIYHVIGCGSYAKTTIDESKGEKWFCTEKEAVDAGWRKALNCN
jgi:micrococcal nuclease